MAKIPIKTTARTGINVQKIHAPKAGTALPQAVEGLGRVIQGIGADLEAQEQRAASLDNYKQKTQALLGYQEQVNGLKQKIATDPAIDTKTYNQELEKIYNDTRGTIKDEKTRLEFDVSARSSFINSKVDITATKINQDSRQARSNYDDLMRESSIQYNTSNNIERSMQRSTLSQEVENAFSNNIITAQERGNSLNEINNERPFNAAVFDANSRPVEAILESIDKGEYGIQKVRKREAKEAVIRRAEERDQYLDDIVNQQQLQGNNAASARATQIISTGNPLEWQLFTEELGDQVAAQQVSPKVARNIKNVQGRKFNVNKDRSKMYSYNVAQKLNNLALTYSDTGDVKAQRKYVGELQKLQEDVSGGLGKDVNLSDGISLLKDIDEATRPVRENTFGSGWFDWTKSTKKQIQTIKSNLSDVVAQAEAYDIMLKKMYIDGKDLSDYSKEEKDILVSESIEESRKSSVSRALAPRDEETITLEANGKQKVVSREKYNGLTDKQKAQFKVVK